MNFIEMKAPFHDIKMWGSRMGNFTFMIVYEPKEGPGHGYTASWKNVLIPSKSNFIGSNFDSFEDAKRACEAKAKEFKQ